MGSRKIAVALILAATALFVIGIILERNTGEHHSESVARAQESPEEHAAEAGEEAPAERESESGDESDEKVLGINLESTPFVILAVIGSLALAALVWFGRAPWMLALVAAAMLAFAIFDIAEVFHQIDRSEAGIAVIATAVAVLHLAAARASHSVTTEG
jgi:Flp pilus assembly protein TadB